jgi:hypothetical protein
MEATDLELIDSAKRAIRILRNKIAEKKEMVAYYGDLMKKYNKNGNDNGYQAAQENKNIDQSILNELCFIHNVLNPEESLGHQL